MSNAEENLATSETEEIDLHATHTEVGEHEYTIDELKVELAETKKAAEEANDKMLRTLAEMENLKRRTIKDIDDARKYAVSNFAKELLPVLDSLFMGLQLATGDSDEVKKFREGADLTIKQFEAAFEKNNVVTIDPLGLSLNPEQHNAVSMMFVEGAEPNTIVNVFQKGYMLNGRLLRPAMVVVAKAAE
jgi:molecular chaperone GrpE